MRVVEDIIKRGSIIGRVTAEVPRHLRLTRTSKDLKIHCLKKGSGRTIFRHHLLNVRKEMIMIERAATMVVVGVVMFIQVQGDLDKAAPDKEEEAAAAVGVSHLHKEVAIKSSELKTNVKD